MKAFLVVGCALVSVFALASPQLPQTLDELIQRRHAAQIPDGKPQICGLHPKAESLARMIMQDRGQQRHTLVCNSKLSVVAMEKAREMAEKGRVTHYASNIGANQRLRRAGYPLDEDYPGMWENQVEAVAGGFETPTEVWDELKSSQTHRVHLLGEDQFFAEQTEIGVGFFRKWDSPHVEYWAVYIAKRELEHDE